MRLIWLKPLCRFIYHHSHCFIQKKRKYRKRKKKKSPKKILHLPTPLSIFCWSFAGNKDTHGINSMRLAEVWMDEYKRLFYMHRRDLLVSGNRSTVQFLLLVLFSTLLSDIWIHEVMHDVDWIVSNLSVLLGKKKRKKKRMWVAKCWRKICNHGNLLQISSIGFACINLANRMVIPVLSGGCAWVRIWSFICTISM